VERTVVGIDVGSSKICTLVGETGADGRTRIIGVGLVPSRGIKRGAVANVAEATAAIKASVDKAERTSGYRISRAYVSLSGTHVSSLNNRGVVGVSRRERGITTDDVDRVVGCVREIGVPHNRDMVHVIPIQFVVDGQTGVADPMGMRGLRLEVEAHIVTGGRSAVETLRQCVERAGVEAADLVASSIAAGDAVLTDAEREMGVAVADIGSETTDVGVFVDGSLVHTAVIGIGGKYVTNDVAIGLRLQPALAEQVKLQYGYAYAKDVAPDERFSVFPLPEDTPQIVPRWRLAEIIEARAEEILLLIKREIRQSGADGMLPGGVVLSGGTAQLPGLLNLARDLLGVPVRVGTPIRLDGLVDPLSGPAHAVGVGLMGWNGAADVGTKPPDPPGGLGRFIVSILREILP
jgi:cell division protein FtsA